MIKLDKQPQNTLQLPEVHVPAASLYRKAKVLQADSLARSLVNYLVVYVYTHTHIYIL
jgi:hypothetical protein